jgi:hypothetical protein
MPMAVRTLAPQGQAPVLRVKLTCGHLSAINGIRLDECLFIRVGPTSYDSEAVVGFLRVLLRKLPGKFVFIWDGSPVHSAQQIKDFLKQGAVKRFQLKQLPSYAPDPTLKGIRNFLRRVELGNVCCSDLDHLYRKLIQAKERVRHKNEIIKSCSRQCSYLV